MPTEEQLSVQRVELESQALKYKIDIQNSLIKLCKMERELFDIEKEKDEAVEASVQISELERELFDLKKENERLEKAFAAMNEVLQNSSVRPEPNDTANDRRVLLLHDLLLSEIGRNVDEVHRKLGEMECQSKALNSLLNKLLGDHKDKGKGRDTKTATGEDKE
ncbi:MAG: hypothetical protein LQ351_007705 [Letrouitia transgressa]|nr:MAG: hypothetical protein LQ351_007705 [Letrouitia transgressa]